MFEFPSKRCVGMLYRFISFLLFQDLLYLIHFPFQWFLSVKLTFETDFILLNHLLLALVSSPLFTGISMSIHNKNTYLWISSYFHHKMKNNPQINTKIYNIGVTLCNHKAWPSSRVNQHLELISDMFLTMQKFISQQYSSSMSSHK